MESHGQDASQAVNADEANSQAPSHGKEAEADNFDPGTWYNKLLQQYKSELSDERLPDSDKEEDIKKAIFFKEVYEYVICTTRHREDYGRASDEKWHPAPGVKGKLTEGNKEEDTEEELKDFSAFTQMKNTKFDPGIKRYSTEVWSIDWYADAENWHRLYELSVLSRGFKNPLYLSSDEETKRHQLLEDAIGDRLIDGEEQTHILMLGLKDSRTYNFVERIVDCCVKYSSLTTFQRTYVLTTAAGVCRDSSTSPVLKKIAKWAATEWSLSYKERKTLLLAVFLNPNTAPSDTIAILELVLPAIGEGKRLSREEWDRYTDSVEASPSASKIGALIQHLFSLRRFSESEQNGMLEKLIAQHFDKVIAYIARTDDLDMEQQWRVIAAGIRNERITYQQRMDLFNAGLNNPKFDSKQKVNLINETIKGDAVPEEHFYLFLGYVIDHPKAFSATAKEDIFRGMINAPSVPVEILSMMRQYVSANKEFSEEQRTGLFSELIDGETGSHELLDELVPYFLSTDSLSPDIQAEAIGNVALNLLVTDEQLDACVPCVLEKNGLLSDEVKKPFYKKVGLGAKDYIGLVIEDVINDASFSVDEKISVFFHVLKKEKESPGMHFEKIINYAFNNPSLSPLNRVDILEAVIKNPDAIEYFFEIVPRALSDNRIITGNGEKERIMLAAAGNSKARKEHAEFIKKHVFSQSGASSFSLGDALVILEAAAGNSSIGKYFTKEIDHKVLPLSINDGLLERKVRVFTAAVRNPHVDDKLLEKLVGIATNLEHSIDAAQRASMLTAAVSNPKATKHIGQVLECAMTEGVFTSEQRAEILVEALNNPVTTAEDITTGIDHAISDSSFSVEQRTRIVLAASGDPLAYTENVHDINLGLGLLDDDYERAWDIKQQRMQGNQQFDDGHIQKVIKYAVTLDAENQSRIFEAVAFTRKAAEHFSEIIHRVSSDRFNPVQQTRVLTAMMSNSAATNADFDFVYQFLSSGRLGPAQKNLVIAAAVANLSGRGLNEGIEYALSRSELSVRQRSLILTNAAGNKHAIKYFDQIIPLALKGAADKDQLISSMHAKILANAASNRGLTDDGEKVKTHISEIIKFATSNESDNLDVTSRMNILVAAVENSAAASYVKKIVLYSAGTDKLHAMQKARVFRAAAQSAGDSKNLDLIIKECLVKNRFNPWQKIRILSEVIKNASVTDSQRKTIIGHITAINSQEMPDSSAKQRIFTADMVSRLWPIHQRLFPNQQMNFIDLVQRGGSVPDAAVAICKGIQKEESGLDRMIALCCPPTDKTAPVTYVGGTRRQFTAEGPDSIAFRYENDISTVSRWLNSATATLGLPSSLKKKRNSYAVHPESKVLEDKLSVKLKEQGRRLQGGIRRTISGK